MENVFSVRRKPASSFFEDIPKKVAHFTDGRIWIYDEELTRDEALRLADWIYEKYQCE